MIKNRVYPNYSEYLEHQKSKLDYYLSKEKLKNALSELGQKQYQALFERISGFEFKGKNVLCLGARLGMEVKVFRDKGAFAIGIDLNPGPNNPYVHYGDFQNLQFADSSVDFIYSNSLDHSFDLKIMIGEMLRVLKQEGLLIIEIQKELEEEGKWESCKWDGINEIIDLFSAMGLNIVRQTDIQIPFPSIQLILTKENDYGIQK